jgi:hypothetical protein
MDTGIFPPRFLNYLLSDPALWSGLSTALLQSLQVLVVVAGLCGLALPPFGRASSR